MLKAFFHHALFLLGIGWFLIVALLLLAGGLGWGK